MKDTMKDIENDEDIGKALCMAFEPVTLPNECRNQLLRDIIIKMSSTKNISNSSFWKKPELWVVIATAIIMAIIGYGIWLPFSVWDKLAS